MKEVVQLQLENDMDLMLAHKRSMKLAELCGLSHIIQTYFATAVSEIARQVRNSDAVLALGLQELKQNRKEMQASIVVGMPFSEEFQGAVQYAKRLVSDIEIVKHPGRTSILIKQPLSFSGLINDARVQSFVDYFRKELPMSPYDELRKKNIYLLELSEKLKGKENDYRMLTETLPLMMFTTNALGELIYGNKWLMDHFGLGEITPNKISWLSFVHLHQKNSMAEQWEAALIKPSPLQHEIKLRSKNDKQYAWHLASLNPIKNEADALTGWTGFFVNIHAQKLMEETLRNNEDLKSIQKSLMNSQVTLQNKIEELNRSNYDLEQFAYIASHDLQEPLRKIQSFIDLLQSDLDEEERQRYLEKINASSLRMSQLIKGVLDYSRLSKNNAPFDTVDLTAVLEAVKADLELMIKDKQAEIISTPLISVKGIDQQLFQLFYNLIKNSLKFAEKPVIHISARELPPGEAAKLPQLKSGGKFIELKFKDNGIGFDQKHSKDIFVIFKRLSSTHSGTGIGLALCKRIVDNHLGMIWAESQPGKGATFTVVLPIE